MNSEEKEILRHKIVEHIAKYKHDVEETKKMTQPVKPENSLGRISRMDAINNKSVMEASLRNKISKLNKLKVALLNIDKKGFGNCESCNKTIQSGRLMFMPESTKCVHCAAR